MAELLIRVVLAVVATVFLYLASSFWREDRARLSSARLFLRYQHHRAGVAVLASAVLMFTLGEAWKAFFGGSAAWTAWMTVARLLLPVGALLMAWSVARPTTSKFARLLRKA